MIVKVVPCPHLHSPPSSLFLLSGWYKRTCSVGVSMYCFCLHNRVIQDGCHRDNAGGGAANKLLHVAVRAGSAGRCCRPSLLLLLGTAAFLWLALFSCSAHCQKLCHSFLLLHLTHLAPNRPSPPALFPYRETPDCLVMLTKGIYVAPICHTRYQPRALYINMQTHLQNVQTDG